MSEISDEIVSTYRRAAEEECGSGLCACEDSLRAGLAAVVPLIRAQTLREYADRWHYVDHSRWPMSTFGAAPTPYCACGKTWPEGGCTERRNLIADAGLDADDRRDEFNAQVAQALRQLDGSPTSAVALLTGMSRDEIDQLGGVTPADDSLSPNFEIDSDEPA